MVTLTADERRMVDALVSCLAAAMQGCDDIDPAYANKTKIQKLLFLAIDEFDLPVTHSWYLAGAVVPTERATPSDLQDSFETTASTNDEVPEHEDSAIAEYLSPAADEDPLEPVLFSGDDSSEGFDEPDSTETVVDERRDEIVDFYRRKFPTVWHHSTMRFLQDFYLEYAPPEYRDVYVHSTHLRVHLSDIEEVVRARLEGNDPQASLDELVDDVGLVISDLHTSLRTTDSLSDTFRAVVAGTNVIEDGLMMLEATDPAELDERHLGAVQSMQEFYYYVVWRYPCLIISRETACGPSAEAVRTQRAEQLDGFEKTLEDRIDDLEAELDAVGLVPDYTDYPSLGDELDETITELAGEYFDQ